MKSLRLWDSFDYLSRDELQNSGKWQLRQDTYETSPQVHNRSSWSSISMNSGTPSAVQFNILADTPAADGTPRYLSPQITAGTLGVVHGHLEARIKFHKPKGAHGALWWQSGYGPTGGEFDVAEFFGKRGDAEQAPFLSQRIQHTIHPTLETQRCFNTWTRPVRHRKAAAPSATTRFPMPTTTRGGTTGTPTKASGAATATSSTSTATRSEKSAKPKASPPPPHLARSSSAC